MNMKTLLSLGKSQGLRVSLPGTRDRGPSDSFLYNTSFWLSCFIFQIQTHLLAVNAGKVCHFLSKEKTRAAPLLPDHLTQVRWGQWGAPGSLARSPVAHLCQVGLAGWCHSVPLGLHTGLRLMEQPHSTRPATVAEGERASPSGHGS